VTRLAIQGFIMSNLTFDLDISTYQAQNRWIRESPCRQQLYIPKVLCAHYSQIDKQRVWVKEQTGQMVKLGRKLLHLELLGLLIWEACVLVDERPMRNTTIRVVSTNNRSDGNNRDQTKRTLSESRLEGGWIGKSEIYNLKKQATSQG
jgi:hypothetical protein